MKKKIITFYLFIALFAFAALDGLLIYNNSNPTTKYQAEQVNTIIPNLVQYNLVGGLTTKTYTVDWTNRVFYETMDSLINGTVEHSQSDVTPPTFDLIDPNQPGYFISNTYNLGAHSLTKLDEVDASLVNPSQSLEYRTAATEQELANAPWIVPTANSCTDKFFQYRIKFASGMTKNYIDYQLSFEANKYFIDATVKDNTNNPIDDVTFDLGTDAQWTVSHTNPGVYTIQVLKPSSLSEIGILATKDTYEPFYGTFSVNACANDQRLIVDVILEKTADTIVPSPTPSQTTTPPPPPDNPTAPNNPTSSISTYSRATSSITGTTAKKTTTPPSTFYRAPVAISGNEVTTTSNPRVPEIISLNNTTSSILKKCIDTDCKAEDLPKFNEGSYLTFNGTAEPNSIVKLYIYSDPIVAQALADQEGNWSYILTQKLAVGNHYAEVEAINGQGKSSGKQKIANFAIVSNSSTTTNTGTNWLLIGGISVLILIVLGTIIYLIFKPKNSEPEIVA